MVVGEALGVLRRAGVAGPYGIALGPRCYAGLTETVTSGGYRVFDHVKRLLDGPIIWSLGVDGAVVLSMRGGDFALTVGQDLSIGYLDHTRSVGSPLYPGDPDLPGARGRGGGAAVL